MRLLLMLRRGSKGTQVSAPIMASTMSLSSLLFIEVAWQGTEICWTQPAMGTSSIRMLMMAGSLWKTLQTPMEAMEKSMIAPTGARPTTRSSRMRNTSDGMKDVKSLNEKLDKLILAQSTMKKVNFVSAEEMEPVQEGEDTQFVEVCYMSNGQGGYNKGYYNYKSNPAMSNRNTDAANPQDQVYPQQEQARSSQALKTTTKALILEKGFDFLLHLILYSIFPFVNLDGNRVRVSWDGVLERV
ncbi:unnamed protein product [Microthlaspi erraticum]|uniref:Uncharacterized protein n=1 Tax=Microthlaspi erraticum TaxID=1685480 RepID=A0A6D2KKX8_9BRAS|nr:unnamed protein product [Microthlaspi erraticum]